jgi:hypothetical protein
VLRLHRWYKAQQDDGSGAASEQQSSRVLQWRLRKTRTLYSKIGTTRTKTAADTIDNRESKPHSPPGNNLPQEQNLIIALVSGTTPHYFLFIDLNKQLLKNTKLIQFFHFKKQHTHHGSRNTICFAKEE